MSEEAAAPAVWGPTVVEPVLKLDDDQSLIRSLLAPALCAGIRSQQYSTVDFDPVDDVTPRDVSVERIEEDADAKEDDDEKEPAAPARCCAAASRQAWKMLKPWLNRASRTGWACAMTQPAKRLACST